MGSNTAKPAERACDEAHILLPAADLQALRKVDTRLSKVLSSQRQFSQVHEGAAHHGKISVCTSKLQALLVEAFSLQGVASVQVYPCQLQERLHDPLFAAECAMHCATLLEQFLSLGMIQLHLGH